MSSIDLYDVPALVHQASYIILSTYDFCAPKESPTVADYAAPLFSPKHRKQSVYTSVTKWRTAGAPDNKIVIGVPCFGHGWVLEENLVQTQNIKIEAQEPPFKVKFN